MEQHILGLHHVTAIAEQAQRNLSFYRDVLELRFIKKTVNFDDPHTYHFYFGNAGGQPGTILTFYPWEHVRPRRRVTGKATQIGYPVPEGSLDFWRQRFEQHSVTHNKPAAKFGESYLTFLDPDGLQLELIAVQPSDPRMPWITSEITSERRGAFTRLRSP